MGLRRIGRCWIGLRRIVRWRDPGAHALEYGGKVRQGAAIEHLDGFGTVFGPAWVLALARLGYGLWFGRGAVSALGPLGPGPP